MAFSGKPQCNRNRRDLVVSCLDSERDRTEVDFRVHRKEVRTADGKWLARPWRFEKLNIGAYMRSTNLTIPLTASSRFSRGR